MEKQKRIIDHTGIKIYTLNRYEDIDGKRFSTHTDDYILVEDFENLIQKLGRPDILQKVIKSVMFGGELDLASLLDSPEPKK